MSSRRQPLSTIPNATNSPYRAVAAAASKRSRSHSSLQRDIPYGQQPPAKKHILDGDPANPRTPPRQQASLRLEDRALQQRKPGQPSVTAFERKLVAARDRQERPKQIKPQLAGAEGLETVRAWQKHYRRVFPTFVLYFEGIPDDVRVKLSKQIAVLGAREEMFFSKDVTHVITARSIPPEVDSAVSTDAAVSSTSSGMPVQVADLQTINPSLLERPSEAGQSYPPLAKTKFQFEAPLRKTPGDARIASGTQGPHVGSGDVLVKAREMGMKIWALEKLQRMMATMFDTSMTAHAEHGHNTRSNASHVVVGATKPSLDMDLTQLLRKERATGPSDRDPTVATRELIHFKGPYIYIRDLDERQRPIMVRDYPKVAHREEGTWPQFRSVMNGKCPFVEEPAHHRDGNRGRGQGKAMPPKPAPKAATTSRVQATAQSAVSKVQRLQPVKPEPRVLVENEDRMNRARPVHDAASASMFQPPPRVLPATRDGAAPHDGFQQPQHQRVGDGRPASRFFGGEPIASGLQQSNITSAIRSQMISSTAAAPGAKAGTSKEVYELKRKVLEKNSVPAMSGYKTAQLTGPAKNERIAANFRAAKRKAQEKLGYIDEDFTPSEEEENARQVGAIEKAKASRHRMVAKREAKPGYCENCRDKFDDFEE
ncbi:MAG: hypothetical protein M1838_000679, partial [Thelocarpon superellum]